MKRFIPIAFLLGILPVSYSFGQKNTKINEVLAQPIQEIAQFDTSGFGEFELAIRFAYGSPRILNAADYAAIKSFGKVSVEYIYSKYTQSQPGQKELDRERFFALSRLDPELLQDPDIRWEVTVQTAAQTAEEARSLFHGFVIRYQPPVSEARKEEIKHELDALVNCVKKRPPPDAPKFPGGPAAFKSWLDQNIQFPKNEIKSKGITKAALVEFIIDTNTHKPAQIRVSKGASAKHNEHIKTMIGSLDNWEPGNPQVIFTFMIQFSLGADGKPDIQSQPLRGYNPAECKGLKSDSMIVKVLERNKHWQKMLVVEDVTGSMMPFVAELLLWNALKGNLQQTSHFVFFNDGDNTPNAEKEIGSTGGIYHATPKNVEVLEETMIAAIAGGNGDDIPENDVEAILAGIKACPDCAEVILIADNNATPRDLKLVEQITKPVHVILCGIKYAPNPAHLYIAWKTKGSLHTIKEDIDTLAKLEEGQTIKVMGVSYKIINGKFVPIGRM